MPFINSKVTLPLTEEKKARITARLGEAVTILNKTERYLMVGFEDKYDLFFAGKKLEKGAFVSVRLFGGAPKKAYEKMTVAISSILLEELGIPPENVYVTYQGIEDWGWNGFNF